MMTRRRGFLVGAGLLPLLACLGSWRTVRGGTPGPVLVAMRGTPRGERVWFEPQGLWIPLGQTVRFVNEDKANVHSATAFHPDLHGRERRIPRAASPWTSELLLPGEHYDVTLEAVGVHDYYCLPHLAHGMVGRIVVGTPEDSGWMQEEYHRSNQAAGTPGTFPNLEEILAGRHRPAAQ